MRMDNCPYPGARPFGAEEEEVFAGRNTEVQELEDLILAYRAVTLFAQSGAGKSSLVNAGVVPEIDRTWGCVVQPRLRVSLTTQHSFVDAILSEIATARGGISASVVDAGRERGRIGRALGARRAPEDSRPVLLVLDQFEELFRRKQEWKARRACLDDLGASLEDCRWLHLLIVIREEFLGQLDQYRHLLPNAGLIQYHLRRLTAEGASLAIRKPAAKRGVVFSEEAVAALGQGLRQRHSVDGDDEPVEDEYVEPIHIQLVCRALWARLPEGSKCVEAGAVAGLVGDVDSVLENHYSAAMAAARGWGVSQRRLRKWIQKCLITNERTRGVVHVPSEGPVAGIPREVFWKLVAQGLVHIERRAQSDWCELSHDRYVSIIERSNAKYGEKLRRQLQGVLGLVFIGVLIAWMTGAWSGEQQAPVISPEDARRSTERIAVALGSARPSGTVPGNLADDITGQAAAVSSVRSLLSSLQRTTTELERKQGEVSRLRGERLEVDGQNEKKRLSNELFWAMKTKKELQTQLERQQSELDNALGSTTELSEKASQLTQELNTLRQERERQDSALTETRVQLNALRRQLEVAEVRCAQPADTSELGTQ